MQHWARELAALCDNRPPRAALARTPEHHGAAAGGPAHPRLDHTHGKGDCNRRVDRVAARHENVRSDLGCGSAGRRRCRPGSRLRRRRRCLRRRGRGGGTRPSRPASPAAAARRSGTGRTRAGSAGWKRQPDGGVERVRIGRAEAGVGHAEPRLGRQHRLEQRARVGVARPRRTAPPTSASSTIRPRYITATRVAMMLDHREVVADEEVGQPELAAQLDQQVQDLATAPRRRAPRSARRRSRSRAS